MIPENELSTFAKVSGFSFPVKSPRAEDRLRAWELGGVALNDPSQGLAVKLWTGFGVVDRHTGLCSVYVEAPSVPPVFLFSGIDITELDLCFDQNMNPFVAYTQAGQGKIYWYNSIAGAMTHTNMPAGCRNLRCTLDEKRPFNISESDIILAYIRNNNLCYSYQRDRYEVEGIWKTGVGATAELVSIAINKGLRLQIHIRNYAKTDDPGALITADPFLADVVLDITRRAGIETENVDVSELYSDFVIGYLLTTDDNASDQLKPLSQAFFFDPSEDGKKLTYPRRGKSPVARFTYKDLVDEGADTFKPTLVREDKLPIRVEVTHDDPAGGFSRNMQPAFRKSNLISAKAVEQVDLPFAATADQAATIALRTIKMRWHEPVTYEWALPLAWTELVTADTVEYLDEDGTIYTIRIEERNEDSGVLKFTGKKDGGAAVYGTNATGLSLPPPISTAPGLIGETRLEVLNIPVLRDQDDELGVYVAVAGDSSAWYGAQIMISTDSGVNYIEGFTTDEAATIGDTETELLPEISGEYGDNQSVIVKVNFPLDSVDYAGLLNNYNRCVIGDELLQFQTAVHLGDNRYQLGGLIRGRYNTEAGHWPAETRFVLIDSTVVFMQAQQWMLGKEIYLKPISFGLTEDESVPLAYDFDEAVNQTEWAPHFVKAVRDGSNSVAVSWIPRPRLGIETAPYNSKYFTGYKVVFSDNVEATVTGTTYTRASTPAGVTVKVCGLNSITGDGEYSEVVNT